MGKIKVLQINKLYYPEVGGIEKVIQQVSEGLNETMDVKVLVCKRAGKGEKGLVRGVRVYRAGSCGMVASMPVSFQFWVCLKKLSRDRDILHFHMPFPLGDLALLAAGYKGKIVVSWHSDVVKQKKWMVIHKPIMKRFLKKADVILVAAEGIAKGSEYLGPYLHKCRVVPFAVDDALLKEGRKYLEEKGYDRNNDCIHFLFIGRLVYYKGCSVLLEAFAQISREARLTIVGDGPLEKELKQQCECLGIQSKVVFLGRVTDEQRQRCLEQADVFVLPSIERSEAFALVQLEAMAYGLPVINTNLPSGVPEVSLHSQTGLTARPNDAESFREAMEWLLNHPAERLEFARAARKRVEENFTQEIMVEKIQEIYNELLK